MGDYLDRGETTECYYSEGNTESSIRNVDKKSLLATQGCILTLKL
jgi:hypothetical protein